MTLLITWLWQGLAIAGLTVVTLRALPALRASARHATWWVALAAVLCIPAVLALGRDHAAVRIAPPNGDRAAALVLPAVPDWVPLALAALWVVAALSGLARVARSWRLTRTLRRTSRPFDEARLLRLSVWSKHASTVRRPAELRVSNALNGACALGFRRPVIVIGRKLARALDDEALDQVVMHEQAHVDCYDDWTQLLQAVVTAVAGLHPAVWWLSRRIDLDREVACDDSVVARTGAARRYATALLDAAATAGPARRALTVIPGATARASALRRRVARLLDQPRDREGRLTRGTSAAIALPVAALVACPPLAPLVVIAEAIEQAVPAGVPHVNPALVESSVTAPAGSPRRSAPAGVPTASPRRGVARTAGGPPQSAVATNGSIAAQGDGAPRSSSPDTDTAPAPLQSRVLPAPVEVPRVTAGSSGRVSAPALAAEPGGGQWQALATSPATAAKTVASAVASGTGRSGLSVGRAFTRTGKAIARSF